MMLKRILIALLLPGGVLCSAGLFAQQASDSAWWNYEYISNANPWLSSSGVTGLTRLQVNKISKAALSFQKTDGKFINFYQSDNSIAYSASTESYYRLNNRVVLQGGLEYENFNGKNMGGSALIDPYKNPVDIDEYADTTRGKKKLERYLLTGAVSALVTNRLTLGARVNYEAANYAKMKDLRHVNKLTNIQATAGASYNLGHGIELGADYTYTRRIESVSFAIYGTTDKQYISLINFGSFYGLAQLHGNYGYTSETRPLTNFTHTGALQLGLTFNENVQLVNRFSYGSRSGYYGERGTSSVVFTEHSSTLYGYEGTLSVKKQQALHSIKIKAGYEDLTNKENVYRSETSSGGNTVIVYYGQNDLLKQQVTTASLGYTAYLGISNNNPRWVLRAGADYNDRQQTVTRYPYYRKQQISSYNLHLGGERNIIKGRGMYSLLLNAAYGAGSGTAKNDGVYVPPSSSQSQPASKDNYLYQEYEFFTKPRIQLQPAIRYSYNVDKRVAPYVQLNYAYTKAFDVSFTGDTRSVISATIGCSF
ncbi:MAG: hypothetical protein QM731_01510 [Chitinophagaceae bacterium]